MTRASVALKILVDESIAAAALRREWQLSIRLVHAHIARVFEFHDVDPDGSHAAFYSMQFIDGPDLSALSSAPPADVLGPIGLLADALRYAHERGVVHRDIKTANVLLDGNGAPYLVDFGVAASVDDNIGGGSLIAASPQVLRGESPVPSDDIFALGGMIYELLSGRSPYSSTNTAADIQETVPPALLLADGTAAPADIQSLVAKMLDKDATVRPDAASVAASLQTAGYAPGPAPARYVESVRIAGDELIRSETTTIRGTRRPPPRASSESISSGGGITPRTLGISLAVLVALLLAVIFLLPKTVSIDDTDAVVADEVPGDAPSDDADSNTKAPQRDERVQVREDADAVLGRLLSRVRTLETRAVQRWGGAPWRRAEQAYADGDAAYIAKEFTVASEKYEEAFDALEPLLGQVDQIFRTTLADAETALENGDTSEALRLYDLAVAISPSHGPAKAGLARARNLDEVLSLTEQGLALERDLEFAAAVQSFERAIELDPEWEVAKSGLQRVRGKINELEFDQRMTEGLTALAENDYLGARAAFRMAQALQPASPEPADGLLQVDQGIRLGNISALEQQAGSHEANEQWQDSADAYARILELDANLAFAQEGLTRSREMMALHKTLDDYIAEPDSLSAPRTMQAATKLVVDITRMPNVGSRLAEQRDELSRLLKRAATPLTVQLLSDNVTDVSIYKVGKLGSFTATELNLRPGTYVAVGIRPGYRDVRLEFRVAPEEDMQPIVVLCEERI